ncbi:MAG: hypothetical protein H0W02_03305, partial [Ktedonobacteraceae bacterium]|nr:hypothetical protein [Ktedonobacteraceae bacterium]
AERRDTHADPHAPIPAVAIGYRVAEPVRNFDNLLALVLRPTLSEILLWQLGIVADENGDQLTWLLLSNLAIDAERNARWSAALARYAISQRPENASVLRRWVQRWTPKADEAATALSIMLSELPEVGREADTMRVAAKAARERVLSEAGILAPL